MTEVILSPFDNDISILYKWARYFNIPSNLIIIDTQIVDGKEVKQYTNGVYVINEMIQSGRSLKDIYNEVGSEIDIEDIGMIYALSAISRNLPLAQIITEIEDLYKSLDSEISIQDEMELRLLVGDWRNRIARELAENLEDLEDLEAIHNELNKYPELLISPIKVDQVTLKTSTELLSSPGKLPTSEDGLDIFDQSKVSYDVPYIKYNSSDQDSFFKLYKGKTGQPPPNYRVLLSGDRSTKLDRFYVTVWNGKGEPDKAAKESYMDGEYNLSENTFTIKTPVDKNNDHTNVISKIETALPITLTNITETKISGEFYLYDLEINDLYLADMIINTDLMNSYLFVKETGKTPYAEKKQLKIYYKSFTGFVEEEEKLTKEYYVNPSSVSVSLVQNYAQGGEIITVQTDTGTTKYKLIPGMPYIKAKITQAESREVANQFTKIFSRLMQFYKAEKPNTEKIFKTYIPEIEQGKIVSKVTKITEKPTKKKLKGRSNIDRLKEAAPDLFVNGYARKCQRAVQPLAIQASEIPEWEGKQFIHKEVLKKRQVMQFPPKEPKWVFVCPTDAAPFPGVKINKDLPNKDIYPCVPCCFKENQMDPTVKSKYNDCFRAAPVEHEEKSSKEGHIIKTDKIAPPNRLGFLPKSVSDLISKYSEESGEIMRLGVPHTSNSLLHAVSIGINDPTYLNIETPEERENYISRIREVIVQRTIPNLVRQEMYDFTDAEIMEQISDNDNFFDPNLFYRAVEEVYNINLYVFSPPKTETSLGSIELPRFKLFHARSPRPNKRVILVFRTMGSESDGLEYPQCELIVDRDEENNKTTTNFGQNMNTLLFNTILTINRTISWFLTGNSIVARDNIYSRENFYALLEGLPTKQIVDGYGKNRAFIFPAGEHEVTAIIPSSQPENLQTGTVVRADVDVVTAIFGEPKAITKSGDHVDGLWYQVLDIEYGIYIPINDTDRYADLKIGPINPLVEEGREIVERVRKIRRDLDLIIQIIIWLYILSGMSLNDFVMKYMIIGKEPGEDSSKVYDLTNLGQKFPPVNNIDEGMRIMTELIPKLFRGDRLYLYSQKFFDGIYYHMQKYDKERKPRDPKIPTVIHREHMTSEDFTRQINTAIFTTEMDMKTWVASLGKLSFQNIIIEDKLSVENALRTEPYLYTAPTGNIYLIQNVIEGDKSRALNVAFNWYMYKVNLGHKSPEFDTVVQGQIPVNVIYGISPALSPVVVENNAGTATQYLQVLLYGSGQYSAMLPLL
jgi:hypothetical protein